LQNWEAEIKFVKAIEQDIQLEQHYTIDTLLISRSIIQTNAKDHAHANATSQLRWTSKYPFIPLDQKIIVSS